MNLFKQYLYNNFLCAMQSLNAILGGDPDGSISARLGFAMRTEKPLFFVPALAFINDLIHYYTHGEINHSENAIEEDETYDKEIWHWYKN